jgi:hypothetical protein
VAGKASSVGQGCAEVHQLCLPPGAALRQADLRLRVEAVPRGARHKALRVIELYEHEVAHCERGNVPTHEPDTAESEGHGAGVSKLCPAGFE